MSDHTIITEAVRQLDKEGYRNIASLLVRMNEQGATSATIIAMLSRALELIDPEITITRKPRP